jgi:DMSO/TMAO reductase YedYZ molybdopterin-dependent catalytic subunit
MAASPESIIKRERVVILVSAVVVVALIAGGAWASGRGLSSRSQTAPPVSASPAAASAPATLAAMDETASPAASPTTAPAGETPKAERTPAAKATAAGTRTPAPQRTSAVATTSTRTPTPTPTKTRKSTPKPTPTPTKTASVSTVPSAPHFLVKGKVAKKTYFTVKQLKKMRTFSGDYFSRGKEPPTATTAFVGVRLSDILKAAKLKKTASKVTILAADDYSASFSLTQVKASYIDETRPGVKLPMIIAWSEDGAAYTGAHPFRLALGQTVDGDYNRQYWVKIVVSITVQ